jgi:hypothetical protein
MIINDRRLGIFRIALALINGTPEGAIATMGQVIVLTAKLRVEFDDIEYLAICSDFVEVKSGQVIPEYSANIRALDDGSSFQFAGWSQL